MPEIELPFERVGWRLQEALVGLFPEALPSRKSCRKAIDTGRVNIRRGTKVFLGHTAHRMEAGDLLCLSPVKVDSTPRTTKIQIGFEDDVHAVVWKPAGWVTNGNGRPALRNALPGALNRTPCADAMERPEPVHRLDRETAGWVLVAKTRTAAQNLSEQLMPHGSCVKTYQAICRGRLPQRLLIQLPLTSKPSSTHVDFLHSGFLNGQEASWASIHIHSGRTHQIRRHLAGCGHPILGDERYGGGSGSLLLVCTRLDYIDPTTGERRTAQAPLPKRFRRIPWVRLNS